MSWARYRLHQENGRAWCAAKRAVNEWVLVDLGVASKVSGIVTQGRGDISEWVTHFMVSYSLDAYKWEFARDIYGTKKVWYFLTDYWECAMYAVMAPGAQPNGRLRKGFSLTSAWPPRSASYFRMPDTCHGAKQSGPSSMEQKRCRQCFHW